MRRIKIATVSFLVEDSPHTVDLNIERAREYIELAAEQRAQIVCLPEAFATVNVAAEERMTAEKIPGPITKMFQREARKARMAIVAPCLVLAGKRLYSQATVIDGSGEIAGWYRKVQLTGEELKYLTPGSKLPVFDLSFGKIAVMLCFDIHFPEIARIYAWKGAEILFWPTVAHGPTPEILRAQLTARAVDYSMIVVESNLAGHPPYAPYAGRHHPGTARIVDHNGDVIAQTGKRHGIAVADVDLDEIRLTSGCILLREPDHFREDLQSLTRMDLYATEYARLSNAGKRLGVRLRRMK
jgi:N-carbamoylputrescine amidase